MKLYLLLALAGAMCLTACGGDQASFDIKLLHADCVNGRLDFLGSSQPADGFTVTVSGDGLDPVTTDVDAKAGVTLPLIPYGTNRVVTVLAKRQNTSVAYGSSAPFELKKGQQNFTVEVLMYPMWQFAHIGDTGGQCPSVLPRAAAAAAQLADGRVLIAGGYTLKSGPSTYKSTDLTFSAQIFDPTTGLVTNAADMPAGDCMCTGRGFDTALTLDDGRVMVAGGLTLRTGRRKDAVDPVIYDPKTLTWTVAKFKTPRRELVPVIMEPDKSGVRKVIAISGRPSATDNAGDEKDVPLTSYEIFDPATNAWTDGGSVGGSFTGASGYRVGELALSGIDNLGRTLSQGFGLVSGYGAPLAAGELGPVNDTIYAFDRSTGKLLGASFKLSPAVLDPAVVGLNKELLVLGGFSADDQHVVDTWVAWNGQSDHEAGTVNNGEADACAVVLDQFRSLIIGGQPLNGSQEGDLQVLMGTKGITGAAAVGPAPIPGTTENASLRDRRQAMSCLRLNNHQVLVMGGYGSTTGGNSTLGTMEVYSFDTPSK